MVRPLRRPGAGRDGEVWLDDEEEEVELARLIVAPSHRGRGIGRQLVSELVELARAGYPDVFVRVHPDNAAACTAIEPPASIAWTQTRKPSGTLRSRSTTSGSATSRAAL